MLNKWDIRFSGLANTVATWSKDPDSQVGAVIVSPDRRSITVGYNGFPVRIKDTDERLNNKDIKRSLTIHAEMTALLNADVNVQGSTMYITKAPCTKCALAIIQARISTVVIPKLDMSSSWFKEQDCALVLLHEAQINIKWID